MNFNIYLWIKDVRQNVSLNVHRRMVDCFSLKVPRVSIPVSVRDLVLHHINHITFMNFNSFPARN